MMFDHLCCINLDRRPDRWKRMQLRFAALDLEVERFRAVDGQTLANPQSPLKLGEVACLLSHRQLLQIARQQGWPTLLVIEDDVVFDSELRTKFAAWSQEVPADWDMLYLSGFHMGETYLVSPHVTRISNTLTTGCYGVKAAVYDRLIQVLTPRRAPVDVYYGLEHSKLNAYAFQPGLAWQEEGLSDVQEAITAYQGGKIEAANTV